jgi:Rhodanese-like domain
MSQPPQRQSASRPPARPVGPPPPRRGTYNERPRAVQTQRDPFPYIMGGIIGAMVIGLAAVVFLILSNNSSTPQANNTGVSPTVDASTPPRMAIGEFKALYDDPAKRPLIIDVRPVASFAEGHIGGSVSMPESDIDTLVAANKVPKDKLIVAYCQ